jgi:2-desacetyl-2-hydroxyethyl bacteriochlorophyllide A dehydrogenase
VHIDGGMREYVSVPDASLVKSEGLSLDELALIEPLSISAHGVRRAAVKKDEFVLVVGAGPIGIGAMEMARIAGGQVIAMDINEERLKFCKENLHVKHTINPLKEDAMEKLRQITNHDMPTVIIEASGNQKAINNAFQYLGHGGRFVLIGLQKGEIQFMHPEFHKRESTLMSSRNATKVDFQHAISCVRQGLIHPIQYITHKVHFDEVAEHFESWLKPETGVIKAMISF